MKISGLVIFSVLFSILFFSISLHTYSLPEDTTTKYQIIDGQGQAVFLSGQSITSPVMIVDAPYSVIENMEYSDGSTIFLVDSDNSTIRYNSIENANSYAIFVEYSNNIAIYNNTILSGKRDGIISYRNNNVSIHGNVVKNVVKNGIFVRGNNITITHNTIENIEGSGIYIEKTSDLEVKNNQIVNVDWTPIAPDASSFEDGVFEGNTYNGEILTLEDIDPSTPNTFTDKTSTTNTTTNDTSSTTSEKTSEKSDTVPSSTTQRFLTLAQIFVVSIFALFFGAFLTRWIGNRRRQ